MKYNHIIFTFFFSSILLQGFSQNHSYKDLYGLWLNPDRYTKLGMSEDINLGDKSSPKYFESRRSLYIDPIEISYIEGGFEKSSTDDDSKDIQNAESSFRIKGRTTIYRYGKDLPLNDTLIVHVKNTSRNLEPETIKVVFLNANTAYFKFATQDFVKLSRDIEPDLMDHIYQFGIDEFFP